MGGAVEILRNGGTEFRITFHGLRNKGEKTSGEGKDGRIKGLRATIQDIAERKVLESQLAQAQILEAVGELATWIAQEINTPTQSVGGNTRFLHDLT